jgi:hypothetical protein
MEIVGVLIAKYEDEHVRIAYRTLMPAQNASSRPRSKILAAKG